MKTLMRVLGVSTAVYAGGILWQLAIAGHLTGNLAWYAVYVPVSLALGTLLYALCRRIGGAA